MPLTHRCTLVSDLTNHESHSADHVNRHHGTSRLRHAHTAVSTLTCTRTHACGMSQCRIHDPRTISSQSTNTMGMAARNRNDAHERRAPVAQAQEQALRLSRALHAPSGAGGARTRTGLEAVRCARIAPKLRTATLTAHHAHLDASTACASSTLSLACGHDMKHRPRRWISPRRGRRRCPISHTDLHCPRHLVGRSGRP